MFKYGNQRGNHVFVYEYYVAGTRYQSSRPCGIKEWQALPCPDLGTRYYIQFSLEDPQVQQVTKQLVPDSVRTVPLLGWARLP